ncbi:hypothetical protein [Candidatus Lokiarchaeum ossiferum]|uniref:hypothetical protein n=1 Tax=Candidatus Lokiarchaeum ossiferum TaxID=2951803 RepID=UPI00352F21CD
MEIPELVSVVGIFSQEVISTICHQYTSLKVKSDKSYRKLALGILLSQFKLQSDTQRVQHTKALFLYCFQSFPEVLLVLHYNIRKKEVVDVDLLSHFFTELFAEQPHNQCGLQLNISQKQFDPEIYTSFHAQFPHLHLIFQLNPTYQNLDLEYFIKEELHSLKEIISYILIDYSQGKGISFNLMQLQRIQQLLEGFNFIIAGGLSGEKFQEYRKELELIFGKNFSIDAQSNLREQNSPFLSPERVQKYLTQSYF